MDSSKKHLDFLDQIRGMAIVAVFLFHCLGTTFGHDQLPWGSWMRDFTVSKSFLFLLPLSFGWAGVSVFFVVSGFCIHLSFRRNPSWRDFMIRRFLRIYPPYFLAVLLFALFVPWSRIDWGFLGVAQLGSHLTLIHNYNDRSFFGINPAFWSIAVEAQLYLLYPVLLWLVARLGWGRSLVFIAALEICLRTIWSVVFVVTGEPLPISFTGLPFLYWYSWSIGALVAEAHLSGRTLPFTNHSLIAWSGVAIGSSFLKPLASFSFLFFALLTATLIAKLLQRDREPLVLPLFFSNSFRMIGLWSYSIYLLHQPFLDLVPRIAAKFSLPNYPQSLVFFTLSLCIWFPIVGLAVLWYRVIELPSIAISRQIIMMPNSVWKRKIS